MCKLFFNVIDNFAGDMKNFLRDILNAPMDLAKAAERFLKKMINDDFLREKIAQASLELAHTTFNIDCINKKMEDIYERFK